MNRDKLKALLPVMEAYANGATVQFRLFEGDVWQDHFNPDFSAAPHCYRIKPEPMELFVNIYGNGLMGTPYLSEDAAIQAKGERNGVTKRFKEVIE